MKITRLTTYAVPPRWLFLKIETDHGIVGWGEPVVEGRAATVATCVEELSDYLIGRDPRNIEDLWQVIYRGGFSWRPHLDVRHRTRPARPSVAQTDMAT